MGKIYVMDTNVLIQSPYAPECFQENEVVLPLAVLEELDQLKKEEGENGAKRKESHPFSGAAPSEREPPGGSFNGWRRETSG